MENKNMSQDMSGTAYNGSTITISIKTSDDIADMCNNIATNAIHNTLVGLPEYINSNIIAYRSLDKSIAEVVVCLDEIDDKNMIKDKLSEIINKSVDIISEENKKQKLLNELHQERTVIASIRKQIKKERFVYDSKSPISKLLTELSEKEKELVNMYTDAINMIYTCDYSHASHKKAKDAINKIYSAMKESTDKPTEDKTKETVNETNKSDDDNVVHLTIITD